jgi:hypothetical protein
MAIKEWQRERGKVTTPKDRAKMATDRKHRAKPLIRPMLAIETQREIGVGVVLPATR